MSVLWLSKLSVTVPNERETDRGGAFSLYIPQTSAMQVPLMCVCACVCLCVSVCVHTSEEDGETAGNDIIDLHITVPPSNQN